MIARPSLIASLLLASVACSDAAPKKPVPPPNAAPPVLAGNKIVLAGGCFWCTEGVFKKLPGVTKVTSGYAGGTAETANYQAVSGGETDHAEAIEVEFDPALTSMGEILRVFFAIAHDPTQLNRQGPDRGRHYRSAIFHATPEEKAFAEAYIRQLNDAQVFDKPIVTTLEPLTGFYVAEAYHQNYVERNRNNPYIRQQALPKLEKLDEYLKTTPATQPK